MSVAVAPEARAPATPIESGSTRSPAGRKQVLLVTEGTYPFHWGGVSTWCHALTHGLHEIDFTLVALVRDPLVEPVFELAPNVVGFQAIPLWGVRNAWELGPNRGIAATRRGIRTSGDAQLAAGFIPPLSIVVRELLGVSRDDVALAQAIHALHRFFLDHDFDAAFRSRALWDSFCTQVALTFPDAAGRRGYPGAQASLADVTDGLRWLYHWFFPLAHPLARPDVVHSAMVGSCTLLAAALKLEHGTPFLLSEHGIYLRERYLAEHASRGSLFRKLLLLGFARRMTELTYSLADVVSPCCDYNRRWELRNGARPEVLQTAYYGLERPPSPATVARNGKGPVVVWAGRIDPLKDLETLLRAAALVLAQRPDVQFRLFGSAQPGREWYHRRCVRLHRELALGDAVRFEGFRADTHVAIGEADLVVLSSISEGFPFTTLEAMLWGKPVVATAVGGVCEQVSPACGVTVEPRDPEAFADAILTVLGDSEAFARRGRAARERAESLFGAEQFRATHRALYGRLTAPNGNGTNGHVRPGAKLVLAAPPPAPAPASLEHADRLDALTEDLAARVYQPVDPLELAAVIESHGITDTVARARYGVEGTFELAERVFAPVMAQRHPRRRRPTERPARSRDARRGRVADLARGPFALAPFVVLLCIVQGFSEAGWEQGQLLALSLGMSMSVVLANGFVGAIGRRVALYLGLGQRGSARRLLDAGLGAAAASITVLGLLAYGVAAAFGVFAGDERLVFLAALVGCTAFGLLIARLSIARATGWLCAGLAAGLLAALVTRSVAGTGTGTQFFLALGAGLGVAVAVLLVAAHRVYGPRRAGTQLPPRAQLVLESVGYFAYGLAFMTFLLEVHVLGWLGTTAPGQSRLQAFTALEVALTLALPPVILASGVAERTLSLFWRHADVRQEQVAARHVRRYGQALEAFYRRRLLVYLTVNAALAVGMLGAFELALRSGALGDWVALSDPGATEFVFVAALAAFWLVGWAQFNCMVALNLGRPEQAFRPVVLAMVVAAVAGIPLGAVGFEYTALAFAAGSASFVWASSRNCRRILAAADHHYATAF